MQFFHLFSFVVVASYAAALPQPAGLSEKYSSNAGSTLASDLETRSYQPVLDSQKASATLVSLKRRRNYGGNYGDLLKDLLKGSSKDDCKGSSGADSKGSSGDDSKDLLETILKDLLRDLLETILKDLLETILKNQPKKIVDLTHPSPPYHDS
ncbi:hypothetical protein BASA60_003905 [Batrachochytrium salamandrivorans]|nr:hypothetical protein BASA60_003905 [Batrachochytrium salamandrivorans]